MMSVSSINSGYQLIQRSQVLSDEAASEIADSTILGDLEFNKIDDKKMEVFKERTSPTTEDSLVKLQQAKTYNQAGASLIQRSNDIIGTILDTHV
ncbi:hypothetical protein L3V77_24685 [Vibrio sp. DW001]|uniref:hypothetical protein n=1 Tax=Vibrio sp. DW001 TaxID=2912315 RepID=UPI0023AEDC7C|nr:hypothetical protein [Vibrio sp. DW001]WED29128.1 hypothetical protein L3V77_24685 [Vibrio sp. DW001]